MGNLAHDREMGGVQELLKLVSATRRGRRVSLNDHPFQASHIGKVYAAPPLCVNSQRQWHIPPDTPGRTTTETTSS